MSFKELLKKIDPITSKNQLNEIKNPLTFATHFYRGEF